MLIFLFTPKRYCFFMLYNGQWDSSYLLKIIIYIILSNKTYFSTYCMNWIPQIIISSFDFLIFKVISFARLERSQKYIYNRNRVTLKNELSPRNPQWKQNKISFLLDKNIPNSLKKSKVWIFENSILLASLCHIFCFLNN